MVEQVNHCHSNTNKPRLHILMGTLILSNQFYHCFSYESLTPLIVHATLIVNGTSRLMVHREAHTYMETKKFPKKILTRRPYVNLGKNLFRYTFILPVMFLVYEMISGSECHQVSIIRWCRYRNRTCTAHISVAELVS